MNLSLKESILEKFYLVYQPIFDLNMKKIIKYEVLFRINIKELNQEHKCNFANHMEVIEYIYSEKLNFALLSAIINKASQYINYLNHISINIKIEDINGNIDDIIKLIKNHNLENKLTFEFLETSELSIQVDLINNFSNQMSKLNIKIALDDFGKGYSGFDPIITFYKNIDIIKFDAVFVKNIFDKENNLQNYILLYFFEDLIELFKRCKQTIIVEYVENELIYNVLKLLGVRYGQGYYLSKPLTIEKIKGEYATK